MGFFSEPAFFLLLVPVAGIAIVLGWLEKPLARSQKGHIKIKTIVLRVKNM